MPGTWKSALIVSQLSYKSKIKSLLKKKKKVSSQIWSVGHNLQTLGLDRLPLLDEVCKANFGQVRSWQTEL